MHPKPRSTGNRASLGHTSLRLVPKDNRRPERRELPFQGKWVLTAIASKSELLEVFLAISVRCRCRNQSRRDGDRSRTRRERPGSRAPFLPGIRWLLVRGRQRSKYGNREGDYDNDSSGHLRPKSTRFTVDRRIEQIILTSFRVRVAFSIRLGYSSNRYRLGPITTGRVGDRAFRPPRFDRGY